VRIAAGGGYTLKHPETGELVTAKWHECFPYLNGRPLENCIMADDETGTAVVYVTDAAGQFVRDGYGARATRTLHGDVRIEWRPVRAGA
jgi:hypothetical protein